MEKEKEREITQDLTPNPEVETEVPVPEIAVTETTVSATPTSRSRAWMQEHYPDEQWENDEAYEDKLASHLSSTDELLSQYKESDDAISRILETNPEFALAINAMAKGMPARVALRRYMGDLLEEPQSGDDDFEAYKEAADKFLAEKRQAEDEIATRTANLEKSDVLLKEFVERNFTTEQEQVDFVEYLRSSLRNIGMGEFTEQFFDMMLKAYMHDQDVEDAKEAGAIEARNEKITTKRIKEAAETDGMPMGGGSSPIIEESVDDDEDDFLSAAAKRYRNREFR